MYVYVYTERKREKRREQGVRERLYMRHIEESLYMHFGTTHSHSVHRYTRGACLCVYVCVCVCVSTYVHVHGDNLYRVTRPL